MTETAEVRTEAAVVAAAAAVKKDAKACIVYMQALLCRQ